MTLNFTYTNSTCTHTSAAIGPPNFHPHRSVTLSYVQKSKNPITQNSARRYLSLLSFPIYIPPPPLLAIRKSIQLHSGRFINLYTKPHGGVYISLSATNIVHCHLIIQPGRRRRRRCDLISREITARGRESGNIRSESRTGESRSALFGVMKYIARARAPIIR